MLHMLSLNISITTIIALHISKSGAITKPEMVCSCFNSPQVVTSKVYAMSQEYAKNSKCLEEQRL